MLYNIYFEAAALAFLIVLNIYIRLQYNSESVTNVRYKRLALLLLAAVFLDILTAFTISRAEYVPTWLNTALNYIYLCSDMLLEYEFIIYCMICSFGRKKPVAVLIAGIASAAFVVLLTVNFFTGWIFSFDATGYVHGPLYYLVHIVPICSIAASCGLLFAGFGRYNKAQRLSIILYTVIVVSGPVVQILFPDVLFVLFTVALGFVTLSFSMETPDYQALHSTMEELKKARDDAEEANRVKSEFLSGMSHELRTPINAIIGYAETIIRETDDNCISVYSENVITAGNRLLSIVNDVMGYAEMETDRFRLEMTRYAVSSFLMDILSAGEYYTEKSELEFHSYIDENMPSMLYGDNVRLVQIMDNLLSNAAKYTENGYVELRMDWQPAADETKGALCVSIKDTGVGMKKEDIDTISSAFHRADRKNSHTVQGIGLGLTIVSRLLKLMDSKLDIESRAGEGTTVSFTVTQTVCDKTPVGQIGLQNFSRIREKNVAGFKAPDARILAVDDNSINLELICRSLEETKARIDTAANGEQALKRVRKRRYDIIFMDHMMPVMDGLEALKIMREEELCPDTPVVVVTANAVSGERDMYLNAGFSEYISKPFASRRLCEVMKRLLPEELIEEVNARDDGADTTGAQPQQETGDIQDSGMLARLSFLNTEMGMAYCCSDEDFYRQIIDTYLEQNRTSDINTALDAGDYENYRILVHALKGTSRTIGADYISDEALKLENAARSGDTDYISQNNARFLDEYNALMSRIKDALAQSA